MAERYHVNLWSHDMCGCLDDISTCIATLLCPCVMFGRTAENIGSGNCWICGVSFMCFPSYFISRMIVRDRIRTSKGIDGSYLNDFCLILFCPFCSLMQEVQEVQTSEPSAKSMSRS